MDLDLSSMDIRKVPDAVGVLNLLAKPLDVHFRSGRWMGLNAQYLEGALQSRRIYGDYEHDALILHWPKRIAIRHISGVTFESRRAVLDHHAAGMTQEQANAADLARWPVNERHLGIPAAMPFAINALEGAKIVGEILVEIE